MKITIISILFAASFITATYGAIEPNSINQQDNELYSVLDLDKEFEAWKAKHNVVYKSVKEEERRKRIWMASRMMVEEHQRRYEKGETSYQITMNHLADMEPHEYSCWPRKTSCRHRHRLIRSISSSSSSRNKRGGFTSTFTERTYEGDRQERQGNQDGDKNERDRIRESNKDGRHGR